jgi:hypothetical protein
MKGARILFLASWVMLIVVAVAVALLSLGSLGAAYSAQGDNLTQAMTLEQIREVGGEDAVKALRGRRVTAATSALAFAILAVFVALVPYRRGERWAWWALFIAVVLSQLLSLARVIAMPTTLGAGQAGSVMAFFLLALLAGVPRIFFQRSERL